MLNEFGDCALPQNGFKPPDITQRSSLHSAVTQRERNSAAWYFLQIGRQGIARVLFRGKGNFRILGALADLTELIKAGAGPDCVLETAANYAFSEANIIGLDDVADIIANHLRRGENNDDPMVKMFLLHAHTVREEEASQ